MQIYPENRKDYVGVYTPVRENLKIIVKILHTHTRPKWTIQSIHEEVREGKKQNCLSKKTVGVPCPCFKYSSTRHIPHEKGGKIKNIYWRHISRIPKRKIHVQRTVGWLVPISVQMMLFSFNYRHGRLFDFIGPKTCIPSFVLFYLERFS